MVEGNNRGTWEYDFGGTKRWSYDGDEGRDVDAGKATGGEQRRQR